MAEDPTLLALPIHKRIERMLRKRIESGEYREGARLPSEAELRREFNASRTPVRHALRQLQSGGLIYSAQGRGSFVATSKMGVALRDLISFGQDLRRLGHVVTAWTLETRLGQPPAEVRFALGLGEQQSAIYVRRVFIVDDEPLGHFHHWLIPSIGFDRIRGAGHFSSLSELLRRHGFEPYYGSEAISAAAASEQDAEVLKCAIGDPLLVMRRLSCDIERRPIEHATSFVRADRYEYQVNLVHPRH